MAIVAYVDIETTGLNHEEDEIWEIAILVCNGYLPLYIYQTLGGVSKPIPKLTTESLSREDISGLPPISEQREFIRSVLGDLPIIAYNAEFERRFLRHNDLISSNQVFIDVLPWVKSLKLPTVDNKLTTVLKHIRATQPQSHRAISDVMGLYRLVVHYRWSERINSTYRVLKSHASIPPDPD